MRKALGLLAWTSLAATGLWITLPGGTTRPASADQPTTTTSPVAERSSSLSRINPFSRSRSNKATTNKEDGTSYREQAEKMLKDAQALALRGDLAGARKLAERAQSFPVEWGPKDRSPEKFLAQMDASIKFRAPETAVAAKPSVKPNMNTASAAKTPATGTASKPTARQALGLDESNDEVAQAPKAELSRKPIQQVNNEESAADLAEFTEDAAEEAIVERPAPTAKRAAGPSSTEKMSAAKSLLQQARRDMARGDIAAARDKVEQASEIDVAYSVFDERPEQLLAEIDRRANNVGEGAPRTQSLAQNQKSAATKPQAADPVFDEDEPLPTKKPIAVMAKKPAASPFAASAVEEDVAESKDLADSAELPPTNNDKQLAQQLLKQAQAAAGKGDLEHARTLALEAKDLDVTYSLFDVRPEQVLAQVDRASNNLTIAKKNTKPKPSARELIDVVEPIAKPIAKREAPVDLDGLPTVESALADVVESTTNVIQKPVADAIRRPAAPTKSLEEEIADQSEQGAARIAAAGKATSNLVSKVKETAKETEDQATSKVRQQAMTALQQARQELQSGRVDAARQKALAAQKLNATFGLWDDRPEALLDEIERLAEVQKPAPSKKTEPNDSKARAMALLKQARTDLAAGRVADAQAKATQANEMNVAFDVFDDRPESVMAAIQRAARNTAAKSKSPSLDSDLVEKPSTQVAQQTPPNTLPNAKTAAAIPATIKSEIEPLPEPSADEEETESTNVAVIHPEGPSVDQLFKEGQIHLKSGNKAAAYQAFVRAYQSGQKMDGRRSQQLQDYLRELSPRRKPIQLASAQAGQLTDGDTTDGDGEPRTLDPQRPIDIAAERQKVQVDRLRSEVLNAIFRADRLREKEPAKAIEILDQAMANIESAPLEKNVTASLATTLKKTRAEIEGFQKQMEPNLLQAKRNEEVKDAIVRDTKTKVRVEREFANLVKEFNELMTARRYAEAEVIAKQAKELAPDNPVSEVLVLKSVLARRNDSNNKLKDSKEQGFWGALDSVEHAAIPFDDRTRVEFGKDWEDINKRRKGKYGTDVRIRTPEEQRIEGSLSRPVTLNFENAPLKQVITHIATLADVNVVLDESGLADESLTVSTPVSIDVQGIQLKNALVLLLEPLNMGYTIKNEVLKITSEQRLQGQAVVVTYSVADLVVAIQPGQPNQINFGGAGTVGSSVGGQMSVGSMGGLQGGQFQVGSPANSSPWNSSANPQWQKSGNGSASAHDFRDLIDLMTSTCEPNSWEEVGGIGHIKGNETTLSLVIRQTQKVHDEIRDLLEQLRRLQDLQVTIEVRFVSVSDNFFERIGVDFDFDLASSLGGPKLYSGQQTGGQAGGQGGGQGGQQQGGLIPIPPFGTILPTQTQQGGQAGQQGGQAAQAGAAAAGGTFFSPSPSRQLISRTGYGKGQVVGLGSSTAFTQDMDIAFRQGSFGIGVPDFGRFDANAGVNIGFAILSDIETFFFINAAQGDRRNNIMSAPKVTLFNGQSGSVFDGTTRPFVTALIPVVGAFAVGYQPQITQVQEGVGMQVSAVISADRRYVRLAVTPNFSTIREVTAFTFVSAGSQGQRGGQGGQGGQGGGGQGGGGQGGFGGIGGGAGMSYGGIYNHGLFGQAMGDRTDLAMAAQSGFGGIGGGQGGGGFGGGGQGGGGQGGGGQGGGGQGGGGIQAAGAGEITVQQPVIASTQVFTTVAVPDGGTVLLGGVKRLSESRNMAGVPILNKIPYLSRLFKNTGVGRETQSLMMMVTPRIVILEEEESLLGIPQN